MQLHCTDRSAHSLLSSTFLLIPRFQRPYSWDAENIEDFWNDAVLTNDTSEYFIGAVVVFQHSKSHIGLVDGQQRFTTITMILCALRDSLNSCGEKNLANGIHSLIERTDIDNKLRFVLETKTSSPYLQDWIQSRDKPSSAPPTTAEELRLSKAFVRIQQLVQQEVDDARSSRKQDPAKQRAVRDRLSAIRDRVLGLQFVHVLLDNEDDAYVIFETLNTRGKDLRLSDVVKTHLLYRLRQKSASIDPYRDRWDAMVIEFDAAQVGVSRYIHHYWLSQFPYTAEKKVFKAARKHVTRNNAADFFNQLVGESEKYLLLYEPTRRKWKTSERPVADSLRALALFRVRQPMPMLLSLMRAYDQKDLTLKQVCAAIQSIEKFHFVFTAVVSARGSGGLASLYAKHARELYRATDKDKRTRVIRDMQQKLRSIRPPYDEFESNFRDILNSDHYTKQKPLAKYILQGIHRHMSQQPEIDYSTMTVEHLRSQSTANTPDSWKTVAALGNQILVPELINNKLSNKSFEDKIKILKRQSKLWVDPDVRTASRWTKEAIDERTRKLARLSYEAVWS